MREILFRGKRIDNGEWVYGDLYHGLNNMIYINTVVQIDDKTKGNKQFLVQYNTIGQFTGLKDKNGVKIFEGDYLHMPGYYCEVVFIDGGFHSIYKHPEDGETLPILDLDLKCMSVIGNIHDK